MPGSVSSATWLRCRSELDSKHCSELLLLTMLTNLTLCFSAWHSYLYNTQIEFSIIQMCWLCWLLIGYLLCWLKCCSCICSQLVSAVQLEGRLLPQ